MDSMQEFWACQWLLTNIGETHKTQDILKAIEIAQTEGYLSKDGYLTAAGKNYVELHKEVFSLME
jgi:hypothetical protein